MSRVLAEELGQTFPSVVKTERIKRAAFLLGYTDIPLKKIAEDTGFEGIHYFTQVFNEEMGTPPSHFRKKCLNSEAADTFIHRNKRNSGIIGRRHKKLSINYPDGNSPTKRK